MIIPLIENLRLKLWMQLKIIFLCLEILNIPSPTSVYQLYFFLFFLILNSLWIPFKAVLQQRQNVLHSWDTTSCECWTFGSTLVYVLQLDVLIPLKFWIKILYIRKNKFRLYEDLKMFNKMFSVLLNEKKTVAVLSQLFLLLFLDFMFSLAQFWKKTEIDLIKPIWKKEKSWFYKQGRINEIWIGLNNLGMWVWTVSAFYCCLDSPRLPVFS